MHAAGGPRPNIRQHVRVACQDVAARVRIEGTEEWVPVQVADLSLGGAYVLTERFVVEDTRVELALAFPTGIRLYFTADVVRSVAASPRNPPGMGLQFVEPTEANLATLSLELEPRMEAEPPVVQGIPIEPEPPARGAHGPGGDGELTSSIYERLRLPPDCDAQVLGQSLERLIASLEMSLDAIPSGRQREQAIIFKQSLERMRPLCQDPLKRVAYDFNHGYVRAEERIAAAAAGRGPSLSKLHEIWKRIYPDEVREAKRLFLEARQGGPEAALRVAQARALDPFNPQFHAPPPAPAAAAPSTPPPSAPAGYAPAGFAPHAPLPMGAGMPPGPTPRPNPFATSSSPVVARPPVAPGPDAPGAPDDDLPVVEPDDFFGGLDG